MYLPDHFEEQREAVLFGLIAEFPLGTVVTYGPEGLTANHIPFLVDQRPGKPASLIGHVARNNDLWREEREEGETLVIFQGPSAYISPNWYPTKQLTHEVVPTYNYAVVHVHGPLVIHDDTRWLRGVVGRLTKVMEAAQPRPWRMGEAPADYLESMLASIVGIEIPIQRMVGKWKVSQNRVAADQAGAVMGLRTTGRPDDAAMAELIQERLD